MGRMVSEFQEIGYPFSSHLDCLACPPISRFGHNGTARVLEEGKAAEQQVCTRSQGSVCHSVAYRCFLLFPFLFLLSLLLFICWTPRKWSMHFGGQKSFEIKPHFDNLTTPTSTPTFFSGWWLALCIVYGLEDKKNKIDVSNFWC